MVRVGTILPVWLRLISAGIEPVFSHKACIALYYRQFSTNIMINNHKIKPVLLTTNNY